MQQDRDKSFSFGAEDQQNEFFPVQSQTDRLNNRSLNVGLPQDQKNDFFPVYSETDSMNNSSLNMDLSQDKKNDFFPFQSQTDRLNNRSLNMDLSQDKKNVFFPVYSETDSLNNSSLNMDGDPHFGNQLLERSWASTDFKHVKQEDRPSPSSPSFSFNENQSTSGFNSRSQENRHGRSSKNGRKEFSSVSFNDNQSISGYNSRSQDNREGKRQTQKILGKNLQDISRYDLNQNNQNQGKQKKQKDKFVPVYESSISNSRSFWNNSSLQNSFQEIKSGYIFMDQQITNPEKSVSFINQSSMEWSPLQERRSIEDTIIAENKIQKDDSFYRDIDIITQEQQQTSQEIKIYQRGSGEGNQFPKLNLQRARSAFKFVSMTMQQAIAQMEQVPKQIQLKGQQAVRCWKWNIKQLKNISSNSSNQLQAFCYNLIQKVLSFADSEENSFANLLNDFQPEVQVIMNKIQYAAQIEDQQLQAPSHQIEEMVSNKQCSLLIKKMFANLRRIGIFGKQSEESSHNLIEKMFQCFFFQPFFTLLSNDSPNRPNRSNSMVSLNNQSFTLYNIVTKIFANIFLLMNKLQQQENQDQLEMINLTNIIDPHGLSKDVLKQLQNA